VAAVTFANGGDNIGIYVPLFARSNLASLGVILGVFAIGIALWCFLSRQLTRQPLVAKTLTNYGHQIVPFVLIVLGIFIFVDSGTYELFKKHLLLTKPAEIQQQTKLERCSLLVSWGHCHQKSH
jgi:cadmium resistance protein CadD (predicted permease)